MFTQTGSGGYDLMGLTKQQGDRRVFERYEAHLAFLTFSTASDAASVLTPSMPPSSQQSAVPKTVEDNQDLEGKKE